MIKEKAFEDLVRAFPGRTREIIELANHIQTMDREELEATLFELWRRRMDWLEHRRVVFRDCEGCREHYKTVKPPRFGSAHEPSRMCRSGKRPHCTCDACF